MGHLAEPSSPPPVLSRSLRMLEAMSSVPWGMEGSGGDSPQSEICLESPPRHVH